MKFTDFLSIMVEEDGDMKWLELYEERKKRKEAMLPVLCNPLLTIAEMAEKLHVSKSRVVKLRQEFELPPRQSKNPNFKFNRKLRKMQGKTAEAAASLLPKKIADEDL